MLLLLCWKTSERKALLVFPGINVRGWNVYGKTERDSGGKPFFSTVKEGRVERAKASPKLQSMLLGRLIKYLSCLHLFFFFPRVMRGLASVLAFLVFFIVAIFIFLGLSCSGRQHGYVTLSIRPQQCFFYVWSKCVCICLTWWRPYVSQPEEAGACEGPPVCGCRSSPQPPHSASV